MYLELDGLTNKSVIPVASTLHMPRAVDTFEAAGRLKSASVRAA